jgi:hypothetical protein
MVVNLPVEHYPIPPISRRHRLYAPGDIYNSQATMGEADARSHPDVFAIRASVSQGGIHLIKDSFGRVWRDLAPVSCYSAHNLTLLAVDLKLVRIIALC